MQGAARQVCFELGRPFLPFQQLLGVLPIASKKLLPRDYAALMDSPGSALDPLINSFGVLNLGPV